MCYNFSKEEGICMGYLISVIGAYLLGSVSMAYFLTKRKNIDARKSGTGNLGASNTKVLLGWGPAVIVAIHDIGKGVAAVLLAQLLFPALPCVGPAAGVACILGHIYPFYLGFRGGKGLATYMGVAAALDWRVAIGVALMLVVITLVTDYIALGTIAVSVAVPVVLGLMTGDAGLALILCVATAVMLCKHWENLVRIKNGTEIGLRNSGKYKVK